MRLIFLFLAAGMLLVQSAAWAAETVIYRYDAKGRLIRVERTSTANPNVQTEFTHDRANNRRTKKVMGAP
jgi:YD repeat-containing protein